MYVSNFDQKNGQNGPPFLLASIQVVWSNSKVRFGRLMDQTNNMNILAILNIDTSF